MGGSAMWASRGCTGPSRQGSTGEISVLIYISAHSKNKSFKDDSRYNNSHALRLTLPITSVYTCFSGRNWNDNRLVINANITNIYKYVCSPYCSIKTIKDLLECDFSFE